MFSLETCKIFKNNYFVELLRTAASDVSERDDSQSDDESYNESIYRGSRLQMFFKLGVLKKFRKFYRKTPVLEFLSLRPAALLKTDSSTGISI